MAFACKWAMTGIAKHFLNVVKPTYINEHFSNGLIGLYYYML